MKLKALTIISCIFLFAVSSSPAQTPPKPTARDVIQQVFKNREIFDTVCLSSDVTAQRLYLMPQGDNGFIRGYDKGTPVSVSPDDIKKVQKLLQNPASYDWESIARCGPEYGVLLNFCSDGRTVRVALCFQCSQIGVFDGNDDNAEKVNSEYMMGSMYEQLVTICKEIFPNDKEIQALK